MICREEAEKAKFRLDWEMENFEKYIHIPDVDTITNAFKIFTECKYKKYVLFDVFIAKKLPINTLELKNQELYKFT